MEELSGMSLNTLIYIWGKKRKHLGEPQLLMCKINFLHMKEKSVLFKQILLQLNF